MTPRLNKKQIDQIKDEVKLLRIDDMTLDDLHSISKKNARDLAEIIRGNNLSPEFIYRTNAINKEITRSFKP